jgi:cation:H+ antiporter
MEVLVPIIGLVIALAVLVRGADIFTSGAKSLGNAFGMSPRAISVLIVGFGSSLPVFAISMTTVLQGSGNIALAYVVGSNITNILLVVGLSALAHGTLRFSGESERTGLPAFVLATVFMALTLSDGAIDRLEALFLFGTFISYTWHVLDGDEASITTRPPIRIQSVGYIIGGLAALVLGASISIDMIERLGSALGISVGLLALTVLAFGTTLPGLVVAIRSVRQNEHTFALGSILGANVFNALFVIGVPGMMNPLKADAFTVKIGLPILVISSLMIVVFAHMMRIRRFEGMMLLILFGYFLTKLIPFL